MREEATALPASRSLASANIDAMFDGFSDVLSCKQQQVAFFFVLRTTAAGAQFLLHQL